MKPPAQPRPVNKGRHLASWPRALGFEPLSDSPAVGLRLRFIHDRLLAAFGRRNWWPGQSPFEVMVGAVLTQNTAWRNVEKAIGNLRGHNLLTPEAMAATADADLAELIRPSGYFNVKARRLKALVGLTLEKGRGGERPELLDLPLESLREALLAVSGVGPETADSILLYAANQPSFVVDAYTRRVLARHGLAMGDEPYGAIRDWFMGHLPPDVPLYNEYHALIVAVGHLKCGPKRPDCPSCPLNDDPLLDEALRPKADLGPAPSVDVPAPPLAMPPGIDPAGSQESRVRTPKAKRQTPNHGIKITATKVNRPNGEGDSDGTKREASLPSATAGPKAKTNFPLSQKKKPTHQNAPSNGIISLPFGQRPYGVSETIALWVNCPDLGGSASEFWIVPRLSRKRSRPIFEA